MSEIEWPKIRRVRSVQRCTPRLHSRAPSSTNALPSSVMSKSPGYADHYKIVGTNLVTLNSAKSGGGVQRNSCQWTLPKAKVSTKAKALTRSSCLGTLSRQQMWQKALVFYCDTLPWTPHAKKNCKGFKCKPIFNYADISILHSIKRKAVSWFFSTNISS